MNKAHILAYFYWIIKIYLKIKKKKKLNKYSFF